MNGIKSELLERNTSINRLFSHIEEVSEQRGKIEVVVVLKASFFMALYNNIEATAYATLEQMHCRLGLRKYSELTGKLQNRMLEYSFGKGRSADLNDGSKVQAMRQKILAEDIRFPSINDFLKRKTIFSGNLDARRLGEIADEYGMVVPLFRGRTDHVLVVKHKRNKIAHGELSLSDAGKGIKNNDLREISRAVNLVLEDFVSAADEFLINQHYLA
ncbi:MAE_28990/MAE_18760 family HEPN-like nuclease [Pseudomonas syringae]|uniref:MAE_28990/MAE_18760 family HEPN-like nuclease n=1 Tax=Pseudomonas syringae TaxID=317 RepID=UPI0004667813|nr:MAE_28990/MAE_18760 family HEPN-like nuclease [Pseudomonas syringae]